MRSEVLSEAERLRPLAVNTGEWRLRVELAACYRVFAELGWTELIFNHITVRVPEASPAFLINPFGLNYEEVTASNLIKIGRDGTPLHLSRSGREVLPELAPPTRRRGRRRSAYPSFRARPSRRA